LAELVLEAPCRPDDGTYRDGMARFEDRDLSDSEERLLSSERGRRAPERIDAPAVVEE
jgi:hypothetical protein